MYGGFLEDIPRRIGANQALDAAVDVLTEATLVLRTRAPSVQMQQKYVEALSSLRTTLNSPLDLAAPDILRAIQLLIITQVSFILV